MLRGKKISPLPTVSIVKRNEEGRVYNRGDIEARVRASADPNVSKTG